MNKRILYTKSLSVGYGGKAILKNIEFELAPGEILGIIGPNGAGKSTLIKTLIGQLKPVSGSIYSNGRELSKLSERELSRIMASVLTVRFDAELLSCEDIVSTGRYPYTGRLGILSAADREKVEEAMNLVSVLSLRDNDFNCISDGQRQRVMLARALCQEPEILIMDEPTSFLDIKHKLEFMTVLKKLAREKGIAVIVAMHELELARKFPDKIMCIGTDGFERVASPEEVFSGNYIEKLFDLREGSFAEYFGK